MERKPIGKFNKAYLASVTESVFLEEHKALAGLGFTEGVLKKIWKDAQPKSSKPEKEEK